MPGCATFWRDCVAHVRSSNGGAAGLLVRLTATASTSAPSSFMYTLIVYVPAAPVTTAWPFTHTHTLSGLTMNEPAFAVPGAVALRPRWIESPAVLSPIMRTQTV